jgi:hypothetical protein
MNRQTSFWTREEAFSFGIQGRISANTELTDLSLYEQNVKSDVEFDLFLHAGLKAATKIFLSLR